jgi:hypothetical protein
LVLVETKFTKHNLFSFSNADTMSMDKYCDF